MKYYDADGNLQKRNSDEDVPEAGGGIGGGILF